jgi:hypothetical protein
MNKLEEINIVLYLILCVVSFGFFYLYWQYRQMKQCNILLNRDEHGLIKWLFLSIITFGIYHFYHEYKMSKDIIELQEKFDVKVQGTEFPMICLVISLFGFFLIVDFVHQDELNKMIRKINADPQLSQK